MRLYIMRHSETDWNRAGRTQGQVDIHLNEHGRMIATMAGEGMADIPIDLCYTSPLARAMETAELVLSKNKHFIQCGGKMEPDLRIQEINFGVWEGKLSNPEKGEIDKDEYHAFFKEEDAGFLPEGAEPLASVVKRTAEFLDDISQRPENQDKNILIMTHGCALRCLLKRFSDSPNYFYKGIVPYNCAVAIVDMDEDGVLRLKDSNVIYYDKKYAENFYA